MKNPFEKYEGGTYVNHIYVQVKNMKVGDNKMVDMSDKNITEFRTSLAYVANKYKIAFRTKSDDIGNVWVSRFL